MRKAKPMINTAPAPLRIHPLTRFTFPTFVAQLLGSERQLAAHILAFHAS
jgi:hypothetical protein